MKMNTYYYYISSCLLLFIFFQSTISHAKLRDFETTRLKATAGAGVGSILMDEASILNPAPIAFFNNASFYIQKTSGNITQDNSYNPHSAPLEIDNIAAIISESGKQLSGSISYQKTKDRFDERKRIGIATASRINERSSMGFAMRITKDSISTNGKDYQNLKYNQFIFGASHILSKSVTMGISFVDPLKKKEADTKALLGFQYVFENFIFIMTDIGANYNKTLSDTLVYKGAIQLKVFKDFFVRAGFFADQGLNEQGSGVGISWVQPKLMVDFALKNTDTSENIEQNIQPEKIKETSFSLSYRF